MAESRVMHSRRRFALLACTAALVALLAPSASAAPIVPQRNYTCHSEQGRVIATLRIKTQTEYKYRGEGGEYVYKSAGDFLHSRAARCFRGSAVSGRPAATR